MVLFSFTKQQEELILKLPINSKISTFGLNDEILLKPISSYEKDEFGLSLADSDVMRKEFEANKRY